VRPGTLILFLMGLLVYDILDNECMDELTAVFNRISWLIHIFKKRLLGS